MIQGPARTIPEGLCHPFESPRRLSLAGFERETDQSGRFRDGLPGSVLLLKGVQEGDGHIAGKISGDQEGLILLCGADASDQSVRSAGGYSKISPCVPSHNMNFAISVANFLPYRGLSFDRKIIHQAVATSIELSRRNMPISGYVEVRKGPLVRALRCTAILSGGFQDEERNSTQCRIRRQPF